MKKINFSLLVIYLGIVLPSLIYVVWQSAGITEMENDIVKLYKSQLKTILFSVSTYADDYLEQVLQETVTVANAIDNQRKLNELMVSRPFLSACAISSSSDFVPARIIKTGTQLHDSLIRSNANKLRTSLSKLPRYLEADYVKKEVVMFKNFSYIYFVTMNQNKELFYFCVVIDAASYFPTVLSPKMNLEDYSGFIFTVYNSTENFPSGTDQIQNTLKATNPSGHYFSNTTEQSPSNLEVKKESSLFPGIIFTVQPRGISLDKAIISRTKNNVMLLVILNIVIFIAVGIIYTTTRKQMLLARQKSDFVANVSHELRTPLSLIRMFAETLFEGRILTEEKKKTYYKMIVTESERLTGIVNMVLSFSKMESGKRNFEKKLINLPQLISETVDKFSQVLSEKGFHLNWNPSSLPITLLGDPQAFSEVLYNLIDNAIKYSGEQKELSITLLQKNSIIEIAIEDKGIGIPERERTKIFEKFYRVSTGNTHDVKGTGLGLSIVKQIVEAHGGTIQCLPGKQTGSVFEIKLPVKP